MEHWTPTCEKKSFYRRFSPTDGDPFPDPYRYGFLQVLELTRYIENLSDNPYRRQGQLDQRYYSFYHRLAPSVVTRSEAELLGISDPRFARRVVIIEQGRDGLEVIGVVNLRRLARLKEQTSRCGRVRKENGRRTLQYLWTEKVRKASCIADAIVAVPAGRFPVQRWRILTLPMEAVRHWGEAWPRPSIPFMRHVDLFGGGMCAQACCFMATLLCYDHAKGVYAPPEISLFAQKMGENGGRLRLGGMNVPEVIAYFQSDAVGLNGSFQTELDRARQELPMATDPGVRHIKEALQSYLLSGFPVLLFVDSDRLRGRGTEQIPCNTNVLLKNGLMVAENPRPHIVPKYMRHVVVAIGTERDGNSIVFCDPSQVPFLRMDVLEYMSSVQYIRQKVDGGTDLKLSPGVIVPVLPHGVRLPLLHERDTKDGKVVIDSLRPGLLRISQAYREKVPADAPGQWPPLLGEVRFRLVRLEVLTNSPVGANDPLTPWRRDRFIGPALESVGNFLIANGCPASHWVWIEVCQGSLVRIWDAQERSQPHHLRPSRAGELLLGWVNAEQGAPVPHLGHALARVAAAPRPDTKVGTNDPEAIDPDEANSGRDPNDELRPGLISSFSTNGLAHALQNWPAEDPKTARRAVCDLYAFMRSDPVLGDVSIWNLRTWSAVPGFIWGLYGYSRFFLFDKKTRLPWRYRRDAGFTRRAKEERGLPFDGPDVNICEWMASRWRDKSYIDTVARNVVSLLTQEKLECGAVSTFLPEISWPSESRMRGTILDQNGTLALRFILKLVQQINEIAHSEGGGKDPKINIKSLELVCGGLITYIEATPGGEQGTEYSAQVIDRDQAIARVAEVLGEVAQEARDAGVTFAVELEPGPLFCVARKEHACKLLAECSRRGLGDIVHLNYDLAHWELAQEDMKQVDNELKKRLHHAHFSGFGKGHFGDVEPLDRDRTFYESRLAMMDAIYRRHRGSGIVSVEFEAARSAESVARSVDALQKYL